MSAPTALLSALAGTTAGPRDATGEVSADAAAAFMALLTQAMPAPAPLVVPVVAMAAGAAPQGTEPEAAEGQAADAEGAPIMTAEVPASAPAPAAVPLTEADADTSLIAEIAKLQVADSAEAAAKAAASAKRPVKPLVLPPRANGVAETVHAARATEAAAPAGENQGEAEGVRPESPRWGQVAARRLKHALKAVTPCPVGAVLDLMKPDTGGTATAEAAGTEPAEAAPEEGTGTIETNPASAAETAVIAPQDANPAWLRHRMNPVTAPTVQMSRNVPKPGTTFGAQVRQETGEEGSPAIRAALLILDAIRSEQGVEPDDATGAPAPDAPDATTDGAEPDQQNVLASSRQPALPANARVVAAAVAALHADVERPEAPVRPKSNAPAATVPPVTPPGHAARPARPEVAVPTPPAAPKAEVEAPRVRPEQPAAERDAETKLKAARPEAAPTPAPVSVSEAAARTLTTTVDRGESSPQVTTDLPRPATETAPGPRGLRPTGHQVTIELDGNSADSTRIRVTVHGNAVRATVLSGAEQSGRLSMHADELTRALEDRGFRSASVSVRTAGEGPMLVASSRGDAGNSPQDERPTHRGPQREAAARDGERKSATDDRPRQQRRPDPEEE